MLVGWDPLSKIGQYAEQLQSETIGLGLTVTPNGMVIFYSLLFAMRTGHSGFKGFKSDTEMEIRGKAK